MSTKRCVCLIMASDQPSLNRSSGVYRVNFFSWPFSSTTVNSAVSGEGSFHSAVFLHLTQNVATEISQVDVDDYLRSNGIFFTLMMFDLTSRRTNLHTMALACPGIRRLVLMSLDATSTPIFSHISMTIREVSSVLP